MKVIKITRYNNNTFIVTVSQNKIERIFGKKIKSFMIMNTYRYNIFGGMIFKDLNTMKELNLFNIISIKLNRLWQNLHQ